MPTAKVHRPSGSEVETPPGRRNAKSRRVRTRRASAAESTREKQVIGKSAKSNKLPGWNDLSKGTAQKRFRPKSVSRLDAISTLKFGLLIVAIAAAFTIYVGHVQDMQKLLSDLQRAQRENLRLHLKYNRLKGEFDQKTGPALIYERARTLGLEEGIEYGPTIKLE